MVPVTVVNCSYISFGKLKRRAKRLHSCTHFPLTSTSVVVSILYAIICQSALSHCLSVPLFIMS